MWISRGGSRRAAACTAPGGLVEQRRCDLEPMRQRGRGIEREGVELDEFGFSGFTAEAAIRVSASIATVGADKARAARYEKRSTAGISRSGRCAARTRDLLLVRQAL